MKVAITSVDDLLKPRANHTRVRVVGSQNPTELADFANARISESLQYPSSSVSVGYYFEDRDPLEIDYDVPPEHGDQIIRVSRTKTLVEAQAFYDRKRVEYGWSHEAPIYRTARYWCKHVWYPPAKRNPAEGS